MRLQLLLLIIILNGMLWAQESIEEISGGSRADYSFLISLIVNYEDINNILNSVMTDWWKVNLWLEQHYANKKSQVINDDMTPVGIDAFNRQPFTPDYTSMEEEIYRNYLDERRVIQEEMEDYLHSILSGGFWLHLQVFYQFYYG